MGSCTKKKQFRESGSCRLHKEAVEAERVRLLQRERSKDEEEGREREGKGEHRRSRSNKVCQNSVAFHLLFSSLPFRAAIKSPARLGDMPSANAVRVVVCDQLIRDERIALCPGSWFHVFYEFYAFWLLIEYESRKRSSLSKLNGWFLKN